MEFLRDKDGNVIAAAGKTIMSFVTGDSRAAGRQTRTPYHSFFVKRGGKDIEFVSWGLNNLFPEEAIDTIESTNVLQTGLAYKSRVCYGQGMVPTTFDAEGEGDTFKVVNDKGLVDFLRSYETRNYVQKAFRDLFKLGNTIPVFTFNSDGSKIVCIDAMNMRHCRISRDRRFVCYYPDYNHCTPNDTTGRVYAGLDGNGEETVKPSIIPMLDEYDPWSDLMLLKEQGRLGVGKGKIRRICFPRIKNFFSNNDYYALPEWYSAYRSGWVDIAHRVPRFLKFAYQNAMTMRWQINVPKSYLDQKFPYRGKDGNLVSVDERNAAIEAWYESLEANLAGEENANKTVITEYLGVSDSGARDGEKVEFVRLKDELDAKEQLTTSSAANSEILFALMVNPAVMGAGMPGGSYAGNAGSGSDIRESALISIVLSHIEKEQVLDPLEMMLAFNGYKDVEIRFRRTILTTLNTGQAADEQIS